ncbi:MAG TPA: signal peptidase II [Steroidobacteraceae bacterium]|jgi:signal peptidase II|nr:signal peptidase II [Steroidobacteraceae bacterium]
MRSIPRFIVVMLTLSCCVGCDQVSKSAARTMLHSGVTESLFSDSLRLQLTENPGSFLSLGASLPEHLRFTLFTAAVAVILVGLVCAALFARRLSTAGFVALALVAGGGVSNLIDRLLYDGRVTDFLNVGIGSLRTGIFNLADMAILAGALILVLRMRAGTSTPVPAPPTAPPRP